LRDLYRIKNLPPVPVLIGILILPLWIFDWGPSNVPLALRDQIIQMDFSKKKNKVVIQAIKPALPAPIKTTIKNIKIKKGDTLQNILLEKGFSSNIIHNAVLKLSEIYNPKTIKPGETIELIFETITDPNSKNKIKLLKQLTLRPNVENEYLLYQIASGEFIAKLNIKKLKSNLSRVSGRIINSLYLSAVQHGLPTPIIMQLIRMYSWDVDFQRSIRKGDRFEVLYERKTTDAGEVVRYGNIVFAKLSLGTDVKPLYYYKNRRGEGNYFDIQGHSAKKALMRTPINGARLTSGFGSRRHPILGYNKMHRGVDFSAPKGTPIYAAGSGTVVYRAKNKAYGNYIRIRHNSLYSTAYGHLSRFNKSITKGSRVRQGQIIGYVGSTGRSTGPHLHYEILVRGRQTNPMRVKMQPGKQLKGADLTDFLNRRSKIDSKVLSIIQAAKLAPNLR
jgi:murein DD-endopeptidase MepM/ murein hydrolase activator NlpD